MSQDYASATIANAAALAGVFPSGTPAVQPPIAQNALTAANTENWNDTIGTRLTDPVTQAGQAVTAAGYPATPGTVGRDKAGNLMTWCTCVAGAAAGATGTITGSVFAAGAGTSVCQATVPANGSCWVKN